MPEAPARATMRRRLIAAAERDPRIVGLLDYGSSSEGRADEWSDLDVAVFLRDADYAAFEHDWQPWAAQFGPLLLAYIGGVGHPWTVYDADPLPLRVDFSLHPESAIPDLPTWPNAPQSAATMVWYDGAAGRLTAAAAQLVGRSLRPPDPARTFAQVCGDFWYYILRTYSKLQRGEQWAAHQDFHAIVLTLLIALMRLEVDATDRWIAASAAAGLEQALSAGRLAQLAGCLPAAGPDGIRRALARAAAVGQEVCAAAATAHAWFWPARLAVRCRAVLDAPSQTKEPQ